MRGDKLRRWLPLLGTAVLVALTILRTTGQLEAGRADVLAAEVTAAIAAGAGVGLKVRSQRRKAREGPRVMRLLLLAGFAAQAAACVSSQGFRIGTQARLQQPNAETVLNAVCRDDIAAALEYLHAPEFNHLGEAGVKERLEAARAAKFRGECPCPGKACS